MMKTIAFYNWEYPGGGAEIVTRSLGRFFRGEGFRVVIYTGVLHPERLSGSERQDFTLVELPRKAASRQIDYDAMCRSLTRERVDCLIVQSNVFMPFERIRTAGCKIVFCLHSIPLWEVREIRNKRASDLSRQSLAARLEFLLLRKPVNLLTDKLKRRYLKHYAAMMPHIDRMVMLCPAYRDQMQRLIRRSGYPGCDAPAGKYASLFNPLPAPAPPAGAEAPKERIVLYAGRFQREPKRVDRLLKIWSRIERHVPGWKLILVGDGPERGALETQARRLGLERVEFAGYQQDVAPYYRRAAFVCLTSDYEGLPMCLVEGQQYGAIPVSFDSYAAVGTVTENGGAGIAVPSFGLGRYAEALRTALLDEQLQRRLRERSIEAAEKYDLRAIGRQWLDLLAQL